ncbi:hypothetical protein BJ322DRAFT_656902 [Thelephora terrestris]|uniref:Uncharacterized protein n=1 Tax=Thelephora terrestris TaxID=56493 RepID=A0A9P6HLK6_9AGAM|nr:hypothetical protein BJ322DRAFT_656902 [Thelephora terrestris]
MFSRSFISLDHVFLDLNLLRLSSNSDNLPIDLVQRSHSAMRIGKDFRACCFSTVDRQEDLSLVRTWPCLDPCYSSILGNSNLGIGKRLRPCATMAQVVDALDLAAHRVISMDTLEFDGASPSDTTISAWPADLMYWVVTARHHIQIRTRKQALWHPLLPPYPRPQDVRDIDIKEGVWRIPKLCGDSAPWASTRQRTPSLATSERSSRRISSRPFSVEVLRQDVPRAPLCWREDLSASSPGNRP